MQIKYLHKNIYKLSSYALSQEKLEIHRKKYEKPVKAWRKLKVEGVSDQTCQEIIGISRATYYRYKEHLYELSKEILPPSKRPKLCASLSGVNQKCNSSFVFAGKIQPMERLKLR